MLLAPVIRERKGEHLSVFEELRAQGFVRARVDGRLYELDELPKLDKQKKHTHRRRGRPLQGARRPAAAPGRIVRNRAQAGRRHCAGRADGR